MTEEAQPAPFPAQSELPSDMVMPCPFCGGEAEIIHLDDGENAGGSCVCCTKCHASSNVEFGFKENFVSNWNRRAASPSQSPGEGDAPVAWWSKAERDRAAQAVCGANAIMGREPLSEGASYTFADVVLREVAPPKAVVIENTPEKGGEAHCVDNAVDARDILAGGYDARARRVARAFLELAAAQAEKLVSANTSQTACSESSS